MKQYIAQFEELDEYGEYATRLKEELTDHFEDSVHTAMVFGAKEIDAKEKALQKLGESKRIIHEFKTIMKFNNKWALWLDSIFLGIVSIPVYHCIFTFFALIIEDYRNELSGFQIFARHILGYVITFLVLGIFYFVNTGRIFRFIEKKKNVFSLGIGLFLPVYLFTWAWSDWGGGGAFLAYFVYTIFPGMIIFSVLVRYAFKKKKEMLGQKQAKERKISKIWKRIREWIPFVASVFLIPIILLTNKGFIPLDSSYNRPFIDFVTFLRSIFENINRPILDFHINSMFGGYEGFYLLGLLYIFLALLSMYKIINFFRERTELKRLVDFPWFRLTLLVYIFSLFFLVTIPENTKAIWSVPVRNISEEIKKDQLSFLYRIVMYMEHPDLGRQKPFFLYDVTSSANYFSIINPDNEGFPREYYLTFKNYDSLMDSIREPSGPKFTDSLDDFEISRVQEYKTPKPFYHGPNSLPEGVECIRERNKPISLTEETEAYPGTFDTARIKYCHRVLYQGKLVYSQEIATRLYQFELMPEFPRYAVVKTETGGYGPQEVYLVDLGSLK